MTQNPLDKSGTQDLAKPPVPSLVCFYDILLEGDSDSLHKLFTAEPRLNTPLHGEIRGSAALRQFVGEQQAWLTRRDAHSELTNAIVSDQRIVLELVLYLRQPTKVIDLPVALAAERDGEGLSEVRVYHSTWPLSGEHIVRAPIVQPPAEKLEEPAVVEAYMAGSASRTRSWCCPSLSRMAMCASLVAPATDIKALRACSTSLVRPSMPAG